MKMKKNAPAPYKISKFRKKTFEFGKHFSEHVHGIFVNPKATVKKITEEKVVFQDMIIPAVVAILAAVMTAIGGALWGVTITHSTVISLFETLLFFFNIVVLPIWFLFLWVAYSVIFHFIGSLASGRDITNLDVVHRTFKLVGIGMASMFLNVLPLFEFITPYYWWLLVMWGMGANYRTSWKGAMFITSPMLFVTILSTLNRFGLL